jgi:hypothetical protein
MIIAHTHKTRFGNSSMSTEHPLSIYRKKIHIYNNEGEEGITLLNSTLTHWLLQLVDIHQWFSTQLQV